MICAPPEYSPMITFSSASPKRSRMVSACTFIVGHTYLPAAAMSSTADGSKSGPYFRSGPANEQCSMVSTRAATAWAMPGLPCACAATRRFRRTGARRRAG